MWDNVGGLVGSMEMGTLTASYATGTVNGDGRVGGLVGVGSGTLTASYATGTAMVMGGWPGGLYERLPHRQLRHW